MTFHSIFLSVADHVATITLDRPEAGNAINLDLARELAEAVLHCDQSPEVRAVVLTGSGSRFCVGGDIKAFATLGDELPGALRQITHHFHAAISRLARMDAPVVCAVNGVAAGGGLGLVLACDLAICAESAKLAMAFTGIGLAPDSASTYHLARIVGLRRAKEMVLLNPILSAQQALDWGLVNQVVADDQTLPTAMDIARRLAQGPTRAYGEAKRLILAGATESLETQMESETRAIAALAGQSDAREGIAAFLAKRPPLFTGE